MRAASADTQAVHANRATELLVAISTLCWLAKTLKNSVMDTIVASPVELHNVMRSRSSAVSYHVDGLVQRKQVDHKCQQLEICDCIWPPK